MPAERLLGEPVAAGIREDVRNRVDQLAERGVVPELATVLMSADPGDARFVELKHEACEEVGVAARGRRVPPDAAPGRLYDVIENLAGDPDVDAVFVQAPLPEHVSSMAVRERIDPVKDVDCFHPENVGRLVAGDPRFVPATPAAVRRILDAYEYPTRGRDVVIVGRSPVIGRPLANLLLAEGPGGDATVTVCHSRTDDLGEKTRRGDVVVTAAGAVGLVDGSMLAENAVVVDVSATRREPDGDVVGDVDFGSALGQVRAITPVPGGIGPVTLASLLENVVLAAERRSGRRT